MATVGAPEQAPENPLVEGLERLPVHPTTLCIFGASGDLAKRKLLPAIYNLAHEGALPERFNLVGCARSDWSDDEFREQARDSIKKFSRRTPDDTVLESLLDRARYVSGSFDDANLFQKIAEIAEEEDEEAGLPFNRVFYLAVAPQFFETIAHQLGQAGMHRRDGAEVRIVVEKPFGHDLASALHLNAALLSVFEERQIYRIDHYLGKETVQNTLVLRFANGIFEPVWNRSYVDHVQITASEEVALEGRAGYYDNAGALRDLIQNHLLQLLMLTALEPPVSFSADDIRDEKVKVLHAIKPPAVDEVPEMAVRAQYSVGNSGGKDVPGYLEEEGVEENSVTETFAAVRLKVDNWRWAGVPFYIRTGKALARKGTEVVITLKPVPHLAFQQQGSLGVHPNQLILAVQPNEGVSMSLMAKIPGSRMRVRPVNMEFLYGTSFLSQSPEAYERLILDTMRGDATLFARNDEVEAAWRIVDPILEAWGKDSGPLPQYKAGSSGPAEEDSILLNEDKWRQI
ncbi:MAG TPA: glucose-6-phosphate dehydrogenase [Thermoleophilaceae bacterium]|nr:glucose-6-phosphate dehydrogenase [Thermoleophilaceae bacterium]